MNETKSKYMDCPLGQNKVSVSGGSTVLKRDCWNTE